MKLLRDRLYLASRLLKGSSQDYMSLYLDGQMKLFERIMEGEPYIASTFYIPSELLSMFQVNVLFIERVSGFIAANQLYKKRIVPNERRICSYQKLFDSLILEGIFPKPDLYLCSNYACTDADFFCKRNAVRDGSDVYSIDVVSGCNNKHLSQEIEGVYNILNQRYVKEYSIEDIFHISNESAAVKKKIDSARAEKIGVLHASEALKIFMVYNDFGKIETLNILNRLLSEIFQRNDIGNSTKKAKILWLGIIPLYYNQLIKEIEDKYQCLVVYEELFKFPDIVLDVNSPFISLAAKMSATNYFTTDNRLNSLEDTIKTFQIDGVIHFSQNNCKFYPYSVPFIQKNLMEKKIPFIELHGDAITKEHFNKDICFNQLDVFFEILEERFNHEYNI